MTEQELENELIEIEGRIMALMEAVACLLTPEDKARLRRSQVAVSQAIDTASLEALMQNSINLIPDAAVNPMLPVMRDTLGLLLDAPGKPSDNPAE